jgi:uncharacterized protein
LCCLCHLPDRPHAPFHIFTDREKRKGRIMKIDQHIADRIIHQTKKWIVDVVVGCNFCPFAARELKANTIHYQVDDSKEHAHALEIFLQECLRLDSTPTIATTLLIFPVAFQNFGLYLDFVALAEKLLKKTGYEGTYQVASFHPLYRFARASAEDPANYTNRSPYPMLHLLREEQVELALSKYPHPEQIPEQNIDFARQKGEVYMKMLRDACL